jgi:hypothetical protein
MKREAFSAAWSVALLVALIACDTSSTPASSSSADAACAGKPVPEHRCVIGKREPRCTTLPTGESHWQIDCLRGVAETAPPEGSAIGNCEPCGSEPAWDAADCVHGFYGVEAACYRIDEGPCGWHRACRPPPCDGDPACDAIDESRIVRNCQSGADCSAGSQCLSVWLNDGEPAKGPFCVLDPPCEVLICGTGRSCGRVTLSDPGGISCRDSDAGP